MLRNDEFTAAHKLDAQSVEGKQDSDNLNNSTLQIGKEINDIRGASKDSTLKELPESAALLAQLTDREIRQALLEDDGPNDPEMQAKEKDSLVDDLADILAKDSFGTKEEQEKIIKAIRGAKDPDELVGSISDKLPKGREFMLEKEPASGEKGKFKDVLALYGYGVDAGGNVTALKWRRALAIPGGMK